MNKHGSVPKSNMMKKEDIPMKKSSMNKQVKIMAKSVGKVKGK